MVLRLRALLSPLAGGFIFSTRPEGAAAHDDWGPEYLNPRSVNFVGVSLYTNNEGVLAALIVTFRGILDHLFLLSRQ